MKEKPSLEGRQELGRRSGVGFPQTKDKGVMGYGAHGTFKNEEPSGAWSGAQVHTDSTLPGGL